jgi:hypothetical protein
MNAGLTHVPPPARHWSARIGELAAAAERPQAPPLTGEPAAARLPALLARLFQRDRAQEHAADGLKANEFLTGG